MMGIFLRRARIRSLKEGKVQAGRIEALENDSKDDAERWQDYGFSAQPVEGQGLVIHAGGHTVILRMDRLAERPALAAYEVAVWHKEGHCLKLKAGGVVELNGTRLDINMDGAVNINSASLNHNGKNVGDDHTHGGVLPGTADTLGPN